MWGGFRTHLDSETPFFDILFYMAWNETSDDTNMTRGAQDFVSAATALAKERKLDNEYI
jgi:hypothetical protein